jgi:hypothetical protein
MMLRRTPFLLLSVLATVVVLAAPASAGESKSDKAILKAGVITKADVPADWTATKASGDSRSFRGIAECRQIKNAVDKARKNIPRARSREFRDPASDGASSAESTVYAFKGDGAAAEFLTNYQDPAAITCFEKSLATSQGGSTVAPIPDLESLGDEAVGYEITANVAAGGRQATVIVDFIGVRVGRAFVGFGFSNLNEPLADARTIVQTVAGRVDEAQSSA